MDSVLVNVPSAVMATPHQVQGIISLSGHCCGEEAAAAMGEAIRRLLDRGVRDIRMDMTSLHSIDYRFSEALSVCLSSAHTKRVSISASGIKPEVFAVLHVFKVLLPLIDRNYGCTTAPTRQRFTEWIRRRLKWVRKAGFETVRCRPKGEPVHD